MKKMLSVFSNDKVSLSPKLSHQFSTFKSPVFGTPGIGF